MEYIRITKENIDKENICCAMSNNQSLQKKEWLKKRFNEGLVFLRSTERGKCFIEYIPSENAWAPIDAKDYMYINCMWVAGSFKGHGYSNDLLNECIKDAKEKGKIGLCILSSTKRKKEFLSDPKYLEYKDFLVADETTSGINLMYLPFYENTTIPKFKECAKSLSIKEKGYVIYYTDQCLFTNYWVNRVAMVAKEHNITIKVVHIDNKEMAQDMHAPATNYAFFKDGKFITHAVLSDKKFLSIVGVK